jgi:DNA-binding IclR family transcriptional regulator
VIVLHHVFRPDNTVQILEVGAAIPWHACALGHAIVAHLQAQEFAHVIAAERAPLTGRTRTTRAALGQALAQVRRRGYALENQEATVGDAGIAAPIVSREGTVAGAIGLVGPVERLLATGARDELVRAVVESARSVSRDLGAGRGGSVLSALS